MGRVGKDEFEGIHQTAAAGDHPPPSAVEEDLFEPPAAYKPPQVGSFPPAQEQTPQPFPPSQTQLYNNLPAQQFQAQQGMPLFIAQQNQPWKTHLLDCMKNPQNAIVTLLFPCVTFGQIAEVLDEGSTSCATSGILYSCIAFFIGMPCLMSCGYRSKLRAKFGLVESPGPDWLIHCFCGYCALCQEYRELKIRGLDPSIGHAGNVAMQRRTQQLGMTSPMQQRMVM